MNTGERDADVVGEAGSPEAADMAAGTDQDKARRSLGHRARAGLAHGLHFAKKHPTGTIAALVALGGIAELELAAAALLGIGVTALVTRKSGTEAREDLSSWAKRGRKEVAGLLGRLEHAVEPKPSQPAG
jgi:hypothetical protein